VVLTIPTNGDYEKWEVQRVEGTHGFRIVNKATGYLLTAFKDPVSQNILYAVSSQQNSGHPQRNTIFKVVSDAHDTKYTTISLAEDDENRTTLSAHRDLVHQPEEDVFGARRNAHSNGKIALIQLWSWKKVRCDPYPYRLHSLLHSYSKSYLGFPENSDSVKVSHPDEISKALDLVSLKPYKFQFIPTAYDRKIFYVCHAKSRKCLDVGRSMLAGSKMMQTDIGHPPRGDLSQQWYILPASIGDYCVLGNVHTYRYLGVNRAAHYNNNTRVVTQKEHTATIDEYWKFEPDMIGHTEVIS
jgi:hypothetical protein